MDSVGDLLAAFGTAFVGVAILAGAFVVGLGIAWMAVG